MNSQKSFVFCILVILSLHFICGTALKDLEVSLVTKSLSLVKKNEGSVKVRVTHKGEFATPVKVFLLKAHPVNQEENVLVSNQELFQVEGDNTLYQFNFFAMKPETGAYELEFTVRPTEKNSGFEAVESAVFTIKITGSATVSDVQLTVSDSQDQLDLAEGKKYKPETGKKVEEIVKVEHSQHLTLEFKLRGQTGKNIQVQQSFLRIYSNKTEREILIPSSFSTKGYIAHISISELAYRFYGQTGTYDLSLIVGDTFLQNPFFWTFASLDINFPDSLKAEIPRSPFEPEADIIHQFRIPDKRPPKTISLAFTGATVSIPLLVLFIGLLKIGANMNNFPGGVAFFYAVGFQVSIGAILSLFVVYWLRLNMIQTLGYLTILSIPTLFFAHKNLNTLALSKLKYHNE